MGVTTLRADMGQTLLAAVASGLALAGVLAVAGTAAARFERGMPHLGLAGVGVGVAVLAGRLANLRAPVALALVVVAAAAAGALAWFVDRRAREVDAPVWPPALLPDAAVLAIGLALAAFLRPPSAIELPLGPLGGLASNTAALVGFAIGIVAAIAVAVTLAGGRRQRLGWILAVGGTALAMAVGAGWVAIRGEMVVPAFGVPDVVGMSLRAAAVGVVGRRGVGAAIAAAVVLGVGESLLRAQLAWNEAAVLPALVVLAYGLWQTYRVAPDAVAT